MTAGSRFRFDDSTNTTWSGSTWRICDTVATIRLLGCNFRGGETKAKPTFVTDPSLEDGRALFFDRVSTEN
jgi:hypothetical protein